jgi:hypothetical protein
MTDVHIIPGVAHSDAQQDAAAGGPAVSRERSSGQSKSMHDGIAVWCDCCSCQAEPYWVAIAEEMGIDPGSDCADSDDQRTTTHPQE